VRPSVRAGERTGTQAGRRKERCTLPLSISFFSFGALLQTVMSQIVVIFAFSFRYGKVDEREREREREREMRGCVREREGKRGD